MNYLRSSASNLAKLAGFSATNKLNHSNVEQSEESIVEEPEQEGSDEEEKPVEEKPVEVKPVETEPEEKEAEVRTASKDELNMFTKLVKNINYFQARRKRYAEVNFNAWLTKNHNPQLGDGFAFNTLGHFFYNFITINNLKHPGDVRYWDMDSDDWNDYLNRIETNEASQGESSEEEITEKIIKHLPPTTSKLAQEKIVQNQVQQNVPQRKAPEVQQNTPAKERNQKQIAPSFPEEASQRFVSRQYGENSTEVTMLL